MKRMDRKGEEKEWRRGKKTGVEKDRKGEEKEWNSDDAIRNVMDWKSADKTRAEMEKCRIELNGDGRERRRN